MILSLSTTTIISSVAIFLTVIFSLVSVLLFVKSKLMPAGKVKISINGEKEIEVDGGSTLLNTLSNEGIFLPSACGGGGTCIQCTCQVHNGGGSILPTEEPHFSKKEITDNYRLGCQVKVKEDMEISIPEEVFGVKKWEATVVSNYNVASFIKEFIVEIPEEFKLEWDKFDLWSLKMKNDEEVVRAYSMASYPAEGRRIMLNVRVATPPWDRVKNAWADINPGVASSYIFSRKAGDKVTISGPYGEFFINNSEAEMLYIGGGAGMAPMRSHLYELFKTLKTGRKVSYWYGGRSKRELFYLDHFYSLEKEFSNFNFEIVLSEPLEEDNWTPKKDLNDKKGDGFVGFVHQAVIDQYLTKHEAPEDIELYFCGPPLMNQAVLKMADDWGIPDENVRFDDFGG